MGCSGLLRNGFYKAFAGFCSQASGFIGLKVYGMGIEEPLSRTSLWSLPQPACNFRRSATSKDLAALGINRDGYLRRWSFWLWGLWSAAEGL